MHEIGKEGEVNRLRSVVLACSMREDQPKNPEQVSEGAFQSEKGRGRRLTVAGRRDTSSDKES